MNTPNILPTEWHRRPKGFVLGNACPICGYPQLNGEHRAVALEENMTARWLCRRKSPTGWKILPIFEAQPAIEVHNRARKKPGPMPGTVIRPHVPTKRIVDRMTQAIYLIVAGGKTHSQASEALGVPAEHLHDWQGRWHELWERLVDQTAESLIDVIRTTAGTNEVLVDPNGYFRRAEAADRWAAMNNVELFPCPTGEMTLNQFFEEWYLPQRLFDARESTKECYAHIIKSWRLLTGDPPVKNITPEVISRYREARSKMRGKKPHLPASANTVRTHMRVIQILLDKLGSPGRGNRDGLGILERVPWAPPPREVQKIPRIIKTEYLSDCYLAAVGMDLPAIPGVKPPVFWRSLLTITWNTGLRRGTLFTMRFQEVDWDGNRLLLPAERMKSRRPMAVHLNSAAMAALRSIRTDRDLIFQSPESGFPMYRFNRLFHELQSLAGIPRKDHFGLHDIRRTLATFLWEENPAAAQFSLGHSRDDVTRKYYVDGGPMVARALDSLPQPFAEFKTKT